VPVKGLSPRRKPVDGVLRSNLVEGFPEVLGHMVAIETDLPLSIRDAVLHRQNERITCHRHRLHRPQVMDWPSSYPLLQRIRLSVVKDLSTTSRCRSGSPSHTRGASERGLVYPDMLERLLFLRAAPVDRPLLDTGHLIPASPNSSATPRSTFPSTTRSPAPQTSR